MSDTNGFAFDVIACALLSIMLWAACAGVGLRLLPRTDSPPDETEPVSWRQPGVAACVGLGVLLVLGGIAALVRIPWWSVVAPFLIAGLALAINEVRGFDLRRTPRSVRIIGATGAGALVLVAVLEAMPGLRLPLNVCDDFRAYLPLAHRLIDTNGLVDPWNARRLQNVGGFTFLQALPVSVFGNDGLGVIETVVGSVFLAGLFVANGYRTTWARVLSVGFILAVPLLFVPRVNSTGVLMGSPLIVATLACTVELRVAVRARTMHAAARWAIGGGLVATALFSVRPNLGALAAAFLALGALSATGTGWLARIRVLAVAAASTLVALVPWSIASWQTVGTPLFPLLAGNQNRAAVQHETAANLRDLADQAFSLLRGGPYLWIALGVLVVAFLVRKTLPDAPAILMAAVLTVGFIVLTALLEYFAARQAFVRYVAPAAEGLAVFFVCECVRAADALPAPERPSRRLAPYLSVAAAIALAAVGYSTLLVNLENPALVGGVTLITKAAGNDLQPGPLFVVSTPALHSAYERALARVDPDRTIAAVDRPYLIDYAKFDIPNMDLPGFTAPDATFPFFTGPVPKIARLRREGYDTLLATVPATEACLNPFVLRVQSFQHTRSYSQPARYYLDWEEDIAAIAAKAPHAVQRFGPLLVIDLPQAQRVLSKR